MTPNMNMTRLVLLLVLMVLPGCFSLAHDAPTQQHFVLGGYDVLGGHAASGDDVAGGAERVEQLSNLRIGIRQLQMAEYLDSPLIVVRVGQHQIRYSEFNRWGGSLESGVMRALESYLMALAPFGDVDTAPWDPRVRHDYLVQVHLQSMEGWMPADGAGAQGEARMLASWEIIDPQNGAVLVRGTTEQETSGWTVGDYEDLIDRLDAGLWELSRDLVAALAALEASDR